MISRTAARWIADGNTSLDDWDAFTSSFGCTGRPSRSDARLAMTSFMFMLVDVPEPVWNTSIGKWSSHWPRGDLGGRVVDRTRDVLGQHPQLLVDDRSTRP